MISVKMTSQGPQLDDGQDKQVVILPPKGQKHAVAAGGLPMVDVKMTSAGPQVQTLPTAQKAPQQIQGPQPAVSQPRQAWGAAPPVNRGGVVRVAAPKVEVPLPPLPEFTAEQLMLCRHLVGKYLADLSVVDSMVQVTTETAAVAAQGAVDSAEAVGSTDAVATVREDFAAAVGSTDAGTVAREVPEALVHFVEATIETIDQALVAVAVRAEAAEVAAAAAVAAAASPAPAPILAASIFSVAPATSIIPAAPSASYVAGRVGGRPNGYARAQRGAAQAPRRVAHAGALPVVQVKMDGGRAVVQNQQEVAAARAARMAQPPAELDGIPPG
jgi:hypothetical protein